MAPFCHGIEPPLATIGRTIEDRKLDDINRRQPGSESPPSTLIDAPVI